MASLVIVVSALLVVQTHAQTDAGERFTPATLRTNARQNESRLRSNDTQISF